MKTEEFKQIQAEMSNEKLIYLAKIQVNELAKTGGRSHRMSVPPEITDTDMIFCELIKRFEKVQKTTYGSHGLLSRLNSLILSIAAHPDYVTGEEGDEWHDLIELAEEEIKATE